MKLYPDNLEEILDFKFIRAALDKRAWCEEGKQRLAAQAFFTDPAALEEELSRVHEMRQIMESGSMFATAPFVALSDILAVFEVEGNTLDVEQLARTYHLLKGCHDIIKYFHKKESMALYPVLFELTKSVRVEKKWYDHISRILDLEEIAIKGSASEELTKIRTKINKLNREIDKKFNQVLKQYTSSQFLADQKESWRSGRRVLAVLAEHKRKVQGITLDISGSGAIAFIEPAEILPIESELSEWQVRESKEIKRILREATELLYPFREDLHLLREMIANLDAVHAKADLAAKQQAVRPHLSQDTIELKMARHPQLEEHLKSIGKSIVPIEIKLTGSNRILVISGPNAGGKSVAMKTAGILQLMAQFGLHVPVEEGSSIMLFKQFMVDIGDDQSIENDLSTYSSHLLKMAHFTDHADANTLFLVDEMGSGTDPAFGGPIAEAILEKLAALKSYGIITTHYSNLKDLANRLKGIQNGAMSFDMQQLVPTYSLHIGQAGASYALEVAGRSGLQSGVLDAAKKKLGGEKQDIEQSLTEIQSEKQFLKGIRKNSQKRSKYLEKLVTDYEGLKTELEKNKKKLLREYEEKLLADYNKANRDLENYIRESKSAVQGLGKVKEARKNLDTDRRKLADKIRAEEITPVQENKEPIRVGSLVRMEDSNKTGVVMEIRKKRATVNFDQLTTTIPVDKLVHCLPEEQPAKATGAAGSRGSSPGPSLEEQSAFDLELDIRGKYKDEAITALEQFLDRAVMFGVDRLRIIHGKGSGVLRQTVRGFLRDYPFVASFQHEDARQGGDGVTLVVLD